VSEASGRRCAACAAALGERQRWCLACGAPTLTQIARPRRWAATAAAATLMAMLALAGIGYALSTALSS
jgi:hypothetical protein